MDQIPAPIHINLWKHHAGFICRKIIQAQKSGPASLFPHIRQIGNAQMDLYTGRLSPHEITEEISDQIKGAQLNNYEAYRSWLIRTPKNFRILEISDYSRWTMLLGYSKSKYIHIHPARYSEYSIRVRGLTLKTAILVLVQVGTDMEKALQLDFVNKIRQDQLKEPPIKRIDPNKGVGRFIKLFGNWVNTELVNTRNQE